MQKKNENHSGADAAAVDSARSAEATPTASHVAHTPTPWEIAPHSSDDDIINVVAEYKAIDNGIKVAYWIAELETEIGQPREQVKANAEFIVRACNAHYNLVDALKIARDVIRANEYITGTWDLYQSSPEMKAINAAIAKAEGRS